jgi:hypothetical protein
MLGHSELISSLAWHPTAPRLVTSSVDGTVRVWDTEFGEEVLCLAEHRPAEVRSVAWLPGQDTLVSSDLDGQLRVRAVADAHEFARSPDFLIQLLGYQRQRVAQSMQSGDAAGAAEMLTAMIQLRSDDWALWEQRGACRARMRQWDSASQDLAQAVACAPSSNKQFLLTQDAIIRVLADDRAGYLERCRQLALLVRGSPDDTSVGNAVWALSLRQETLHELPDLRDLYTQAARVTRHNYELASAGWIRLRLGQYTEALEAAAMLGERDSAWRFGHQAVIEAMAHARLGNLDQAREAAERASAWREQRGTALGAYWFLDAYFEICYEEMQATVAAAAQISR